MDKNFYITTSILYASGTPHVGNMAELILADAIARYKKLMGYDVYFQTGTDEHGEKIENKAKELNITPEEFIEKIVLELKNLIKLCNIEYDYFMQTSFDYHKTSVQNIFTKLLENQDIYLGEYEGFYCVPCESFFTKTQCSDEICPDCGRPIEYSKEEAHFLKLTKYKEKLLTHIKNNPDFIMPGFRTNEMLKNFIENDLEDLCISRKNVKWGIQVPNDLEKTIYVWLDALPNYITSLGYDPKKDNSELFNKFWPCDTHLIGKDILRFHSIYWPIMLMALGLELPKTILTHSWFIAEDGTKMSKSKGNVLHIEDILKEVSTDTMRYYILSELNKNNDSKISMNLIKTNNNADLCNNIGNLVNRTISMSKRYFKDEMPKNYKEYLDIDKELISNIKTLKESVEKHVNNYDINLAVNEIIVFAKSCNKYIDETTPWLLCKNEEDMPRLEQIIYNLLESIRVIGILLQPIIPDSAKQILDQINTEVRTFSSINDFNTTEQTKTLNNPQPIFIKYD